MATGKTKKQKPVACFNKLTKTRGNFAQKFIKIGRGAILEFKHKPVLLEETIEGLNIRKKKTAERTK